MARHIQGSALWRLGLQDCGRRGGYNSRVQQVCQWRSEGGVRVQLPCFFSPGAEHLLLQGVWLVLLVRQYLRLPAVGCRVYLTESCVASQ
jgi:hypothetical protein